MLSKLKDDELIAEYLKGNERAFSVLVNRHEKYLINFLSSDNINHEDVLDTIQETWIRVMRYVINYKPDGKFRAWLTFIARNSLINIYRKEKKKHNYLPLDADVDEGGHYQISNLISDNVPNIQERIIEMEEEIDWDLVIEFLNERKSRNKFGEVLRGVLDEKIHLDIAAELGIPDGTVKSSMHRVKAILKEQFEINIEQFYKKPLTMETVVPKDLKHCTKCDTYKEKEEFGKNSSTKDGLNNWCKGCVKIYQDERRKNHREKIETESDVQKKLDDFEERAKKLELEKLIKQEQSKTVTERLIAPEEKLVEFDLNKLPSPPDFQVGLIPERLRNKLLKTHFETIGYHHYQMSIVYSEIAREIGNQS